MGFYRPCHAVPWNAWIISYSRWSVPSRSERIWPCRTVHREDPWLNGMNYWFWRDIPAYSHRQRLPWDRMSHNLHRWWWDTSYRDWVFLPSVLLLLLHESSAEAEQLHLCMSCWEHQSTHLHGTGWSLRFRRSPSISLCLAVWQNWQLYRQWQGDVCPWLSSYRTWRLFS